MEKNKEGLSHQDKLLMQLQQAKLLVCMYLRSGTKVQGIVTDFDAKVIILRNAGKDHMIFKHTILTIVPLL